MTPPRIVPDHIRQRALEIARTQSETEARRYLGKVMEVGRSQRDELYRTQVKGTSGGGAAKGGDGGGGKEPGSGTSDTQEGSRDAGDFDVTVETSIPKTLDEVVQLCKVDLDAWEPKGFSVTRKKSAFGWNARFARKTKPTDITPLLAAFGKAAEGHAPRKWSADKVAAKNRDCLYVLNIQDLHLSKLSWHKEAGADYDISIAKRVYTDAVKDLLSKAPKDRIEEVLLIAGSDFLQTDTDESTTTAGTYVDSDGRLAKAFSEGCKLLTDTAEMLGGQFRVKIIVIPGNHDEQVSQFMGAYLSAWFRSHPNVTVDNEPRTRKYHAYGKVLLGLVHGHREKPKDLPLIMMRENQETISRYKWQEWLTGHLHIERTDELHGIKMRTAPALCAPDQWHFSQGYVGTIRTSQGLLYNRENGLEAIYYSTPLD